MARTKLEAVAENRFVKYVKKEGYICLKMNPDGEVGYPDRQVFLGNGHHYMIEFKRKGEKPEPIQRHRHEQLKRLGHHVFWVDNYEEAIKIHEREKARSLPYSS